MPGLFSGSAFGFSYIIDYFPDSDNFLGSETKNTVMNSIKPITV